MVKNFELTDEQRLICESVENGYNVIVDAVAGSGKTRTILEMVTRNPWHQILCTACTVQA